MKRLMIVCLLATSLLHAGGGKGVYELSGELIVWEPCNRDFVFTHRAAAQPNRNDLFTVEPEYGAGFRVGFGYTDCEGVFCVDIRYTYWDGRVSRSVTGTNLRLEVPNFSLNLTRVDGRRHLEYQEGDLRLRRSLICDSCYGISAVGGVRFVYLEEDERSTGLQTPPATPIIIAQRDKFIGFTFNGGLSGYRTLCWNLLLKGEVLGMVGAGEQTNNWAVLSGAGAGISSYGGRVPSSFNCITGVDGKVSLARPFCIARCSLAVEIGYEILYYINALRHVEPITPDAYALPTYGVGFQGPFLKLGAIF